MKTWREYGSEWLDTLVVAISVAMAFRAYFFEPFNIPTGSMQPTLYGNHSERCEEAGVFQTTPLKWFNWLLTGRDYKEFKAPFSGNIVFHDGRNGRFDFAISSPTGAGLGGQVSLPTDALRNLDIGEAYAGRELWVRPARDHRYAVLCVKGPNGEEPVRVPAGHVIWRGYDTTGDFIFVNRWAWNFRSPARGDVMVFSTTGITALDQGTHYIKRLTALPGETIEIKKPDVFIDGVKLDPIKPMSGARGESTPEPNPGGMHGPVTLKAGEYFACGDNSDNSSDSRYWGPVPEGNLKGVGSIVFWPIINPRWGVIK